MKKIAAIATAAGLMFTIAATASAAEVTGVVQSASTVTSATYGEPVEPVITPEDIKPATPQIILTEAAPFHFSPDSFTPAGWLSPQIVDTTGNMTTDAFGNDWREVYTWLGKAWIKVPATANVVEP